MEEYSSDDVQQALVPIASLISKSEKAQTKLAPGTWQHTMLEDNLRALRLATALMTEDALPATGFSPGDLREALRAIASMIERTEKAGSKFAPGTSQHSLQRNRLHALRIAETFVSEALESR